jgi:hypothetical protein
MVRYSLSNRCSGEADRHKSLTFNDEAEGLGKPGTPKCAMLSRQKEGVSALMSQRLCGPTFSEIPVCVLLKSSANAKRKRVDYFHPKAEQRHCFRMLALLDFPGR